MIPKGFTEGPPRYFIPVCCRTERGFYGGPIGYRESSQPMPTIILEESQVLLLEEGV